MGQILSSFAISVAANIATALFARNNTEKEIRKAFQEAIEMWCPNEDIRRHREPFIYNFVNEYIANPALDFSELTEEQRSFLQCFEKCVANHHSASLYLSAIKEKEYYDIVMASLNRVHSKLDDISKKLDEANPRNEELHFEAVAQINTVLKEIVEDPVNVLLFGVLSAFEEEIFAYTNLREDGNIEVIIEKESQLVEDEDGEYYRPKFSDFEYDWSKENRPDWMEIEPDIDFWNLFSNSHIAAFQLMNIGFFDGIEELQAYLDKKSINDQLSTAEKKQLNYIIQNMRAVQCMFDDHRDVLCKMETRFLNLTIRLVGKMENLGMKLGNFEISYHTDSYSEKITDVLAPLEAEEKLLDVYMINPEYYYKVSGYLGELFESVREWWKMSNDMDCRYSLS